MLVTGADLFRFDMQLAAVPLSTNRVSLNITRCSGKCYHRTLMFNFKGKVHPALTIYNYMLIASDILTFACIEIEIKTFYSFDTVMRSNHRD